MSDLSASDVLAMTKENGGFLEGNGIIILLLFLLFLGGGFGGGFGNNASAMQNALTRAEMQDGFNNQNTVNTLNNLSIGLNNGFNNVAMGMTNGFNSVNSAIANLDFNMQQCCCDIKTTIGNQTTTIMNALNDQTIQALRDKVADKDRELNSAIFAASQLTQTKTLEDFILANKA